MEPERHDVLVIGGGAAGRSAALVLGRARRRVALVDAGEPSNRVSEGIGGFLGNDQRSPEEFYEATRRELARYPTVSWRQGTVEGVQRSEDEDAWVASLDNGSTLAGAHVVLAMGMRYAWPDVPGIEPFWGASVFHCPFCHGWEHRDQPLLVLAGLETVRRALLLRNWSDDVTVIASSGDLGEAEREILAAEAIPVVEGEVVGLRGRDRQLEGVELAGGTVVPGRGMLVAAPHQPRSELVASLGVETDESGHVVVDELGRTTVDKVWAVGDLTSPMAFVSRVTAAGAQAAAWITFDLVLSRHAELTP